MKVFKITLTIFSLLAYCTSLSAISSVRPMIVTIKNETPQEFIVKLVNLESSQEVLIEILNAQGKGRDVVKLSVPPELYGIIIYHAPTDKITRVSAKALRSFLLPGSNCSQITLRPSLQVGEPQIVLGSTPTC